IRWPDREHLERLFTSYCFFRMPSFARKTLLIFARNRCVKLDHRFAAFNRRIRSARHHNARLDKTFPRIRASQTIDAESTRREEKIANRMRRLHRRNDSELRKTRNVSR